MPATEPLNGRMGSNLPGGAVIEQLLWARIRSAKPVAILFIELTNLEAYNSEYECNKGEEIIQFLAEDLADVVTSIGGKDDAIGHIWGDRFVVVSTPPYAEQLSQEIIKRFDAGIPQYYSPEARSHHYIDGLDRRGNPFRVLMASLAIAIVTNERRPLEHPLQIEELGSEVIRYIKSWPGSNYAFDRRLK